MPVPDSLKYLGREVYLLTSNSGTISAGEAFVYDLHLLKTLQKNAVDADRKDSLRLAIEALEKN